MAPKAAANPKNKTVLSGVKASTAIAPATIYKTFGRPKSCFTSVAAFEPFVTRIPVERDIKSEGI